MPPIRGRRADSSKSSSSGQRPNTIGVPARDLEVLLDRLDERSHGGGNNIKRTYARWPFRHNSLRLTLEHPGGSRSVLQVACRNLSRGGTGVLHSAFVHTGTTCVLELPRLDGQREAISSTIVRCTHLQGVVHELGVRFDHPIQIEDFIRLNPLMGWSSFERVEPSTLSGSLLVVTDSELDERIIGHYLSDSQLKIKFVRTAAEAAQMERGSADIALIDLSVEGSEELFAVVRNHSVALSAVAIGPNAGSETRMKIQDIGADGFVFKPLSNERLLSVLADCLLGGDSFQIDPKIAGEAGGALAANCIEQLRNYAAQLREGVADDDAMRCYAICQQITTAAMPVQLHPITKLAQQTASALAQSMSCPESAGKLQELARACERVRVSAAA